MCVDKTGRGRVGKNEVLEELEDELRKGKNEEERRALGGRIKSYSKREMRKEES